MPPESTRPSLLRLDRRELSGLRWLRQWARWRLTAHKRRRKYRPPATTFEAQEAEVLQALVDLERTAGRLLEGVEGKG